jgi:hypothetical protein
LKFIQLQYILLATRGSRGCDRMVVGFENFCVIIPIINNV